MAKASPYLKNKAKRAGDVVHVSEHLLSKPKALSSNSVLPKKKKKKRKKENLLNHIRIVYKSYSMNHTYC
jgi:hypothetical protein